MTSRFHLDPVGGISGDMFISAILDSRPELGNGLPAVLSAIGLDAKVSIQHLPHDTGVLTGSRFLVEEFNHQDQHSHDHNHSTFRDIRNMLRASDLKDGVKRRAIDIFERLAHAEAKVHGVSAEDVAFHEVGALDSIADITLSAHLIEALGAGSWSLNQIPMGSGRVQTQHGLLPLPAPATLLLLHGLPVFDDGIVGERVTPTGAAILSHLEPIIGGPSAPMRLQNSGMGFGSSELQSLPNVLRIMEFVPLTGSTSDQVTVLAFEVDDQTPEDLAVGLDNLRNTAGVLDVMVSAVTAKKGRQANSIQVLSTPEAEHKIIEACYTQTTTLGIRHQRVWRSILERQHVQIGDVGVKIATRPDGKTAKAEMDDLAKNYPNHAARFTAGHSFAAEAISDSDLEPLK